MTAAAVEVELKKRDSAQPGQRHQVMVAPRAWSARLGRALLVTLAVCVVGVVLVPIPLFHLCGAVLALIVAPIAGLSTLRSTVTVAATALPCAGCGESVSIAAGTFGWPVSLHCERCGVALRLAPVATGTQG